jgi:hypothetical protein
VAALLILAPYGVVFLSTTAMLRVPEASAALARLVRRG